PVRAPGRARRHTGSEAYRPRVLSVECHGVDVVFHIHAARSAHAMNEQTSKRANKQTQLPVTLAMTGASGAPYAVRLLEVLNDAHVPVNLVISETGWRLLDEELDIKDEAGLRAVTGDWSHVTLFADKD